ncbi:hypothetical protein CXB51_028447 [Gossypium anomalum]|uniref:Uncharacterized protein n=1 Tax=Gossypium anomalum TaxID=47600 RepID=A0A8J5Y6C1_9ROSI|nr:hypothetical protein CXB51_028447 [Gossypium anomalum]
MASGDPHISFALRGVHHHSRRCYNTARAPYQRECGHGRKFDLQAGRSSLHYAPYRGCTYDRIKRQYYALDDDRSFCDGHRRMPHTAAVVGTLLDTILGIN